MAGLGGRERTLIGVGVALVLLVALYLFLVEPLVDRAREVEDRTAAREASLERRRLAIARGPGITEELQTARRRLESESARLLRGPTAPLAASELQKLVKEAAAGSNVEVRSERVLPASEREGLQEVPIEIVIAGSIRDTIGALYRIEHAERLLTIKELKVRVVAVGQPRELLTTLIVAGYVMPDTGPRPAAKPMARAN
ncbi:MAG TPA: type II secretion system protein GspM [Methylomirabilota bacterium]|nr:type II secretion system protein GspM [Methylomirabilota bacterium]